jgi:hypothetical protein
VSGSGCETFESEMMPQVWTSGDANALQCYESLPAELQLRSFLGLVDPTPTAGYRFFVTPEQTVCAAPSLRCW